MEQKYLLTVAAFYTWFLIASSPSTDYSLSFLMTNIIYLGNAPVKEVKMFSLAPASPSWRSAIELSAVSEKKKVQKNPQNKTGPSCFDVAISVC